MCAYLWKRQTFLVTYVMCWTLCIKLLFMVIKSNKIYKLNQINRKIVKTSHNMIIFIIYTDIWCQTCGYQSPPLPLWQTNIIMLYMMICESRPHPMTDWCWYNWTLTGRRLWRNTLEGREGIFSCSPSEVI